MTESQQRALRIKKSARKNLVDLQPKFFKQVMTKILQLLEDAQPQDCKSLKGYSGVYRVDQGEYRILYTISEDAIEVFRVGKRNDDEVYENL
ncbi:cytotoxic translational repressor of toxin-antitoxin stability system [Scytonema hofmannii PCC 7110]|uniref:Cytotoxic translational repressor of toxin-antitoxin stability system n=1 Tax=Scytonema hofmannii PCC 7110 TaxID=128403 RepID=A0A139X5V0_9CYAN|nr:type II toxin-antitoxin system RelE/ParE family toxin [Scytonema hofmannii]KYC40091.1 cytotoxic translational repressor of toxin-antitoxin stability system [Scytonema hofmannii PCC 7110]